MVERVEDRIFLPCFRRIIDKGITDVAKAFCGYPNPFFNIIKYNIPYRDILREHDILKAMNAVIYSGGNSCHDQYQKDRDLINRFLTPIADYDIQCRHFRGPFMMLGHLFERGVFDVTLAADYSLCRETGELTPIVRDQNVKSPYSACPVKVIKGIHITTIQFYESNELRYDSWSDRMVGKPTPFWSLYHLSRSPLDHDTIESLRNLPLGYDMDLATERIPDNCLPLVGIGENYSTVLIAPKNPELYDIGLRNSDFDSKIQL